jgi:ADP-heptose:LPS heptosyltransferase
VKTVIISPFSRSLRNGKENPKNYPYWDQVISKLKTRSIRIVQIGRSNEKCLDADEVKHDLKLVDLKKLINKTDLCLAVDNFLPHLCANMGKRCVVIFGKSDPNIFGYYTNTNLLKDRKYLRKRQFETWEQEQYEPECFIEPDIIVKTVTELLEEKT